MQALTVDYVSWGKDCARVAAGNDRFYWPHGTSGLAQMVLRPLYKNWMLELAISAEFGSDYPQGISRDPVLFAEYFEHLEQMDCFLSHYRIEPKSTAAS